MDRPRKRGSRNYCKYSSAIQRSDQKLWRFSAVIHVWRDKTSFSTKSVSRGSTRKRASRNYCKYLSAITRSDQKLWPFSGVNPVWRHKTSSPSSRDSTCSTRKRASGNYCNYLRAIQRWIKSYGPFQLLFRSGATRPPFQLRGMHRYYKETGVQKLL